MWQEYKNGKGARRSDGLSVRRAQNWFPFTTQKRVRVGGWDVCASHTILGTFPDCPLTEAKAKVDLEFPWGVKRRSRNYYRVHCPQCTLTNHVQAGNPVPWDVVFVCGACSHTESLTLAVCPPAREIDLLPEQVVGIAREKSK